MLSTLKNSWKVPDLRKRLLFTFFIVLIFRLGNHITVPYVDIDKMSNISQSNAGGLVGFYDLVSGGAFSKLTIFAMGVVPYINASIIMQLLTIAIPYLEQLSKEGEDGRKKIQKYTRIAAVFLAAIQSYGMYVYIWNYYNQALKDTSKFSMVIIMITLTTSSVFLMWLGDQITVKGLGNGMSLLIFINIISRLPMTAWQIATSDVNPIEIIVFIVVLLGLLVSIILMSLAERRINVQYAGKVVGNRTYKSQSTHIPINLIASGVIAIIFAMSVMQFPATIGQFWSKSWFVTHIINSANSPFNPKSLSYAIFYGILVIFFSWFYTQVTFKPDEMAENMHKSSGFIPGIRPGQQTARHIEKVLTKVSLIGGTYAAIIAIVPIIIANSTSFNNIQFGGTTFLIMVGVALDTMRQLESQLVMRHYQGFLK
jgi:preprotein translocase, SecY subunit